MTGKTNAVVSPCYYSCNHANGMSSEPACAYYVDA